jgi:hypothetical protein
MDILAALGEQCPEQPPQGPCSDYDDFHGNTWLREVMQLRFSIFSPHSTERISPYQAAPVK